MMKMMGTVTDVLVTPLTYLELLAGFSGSPAPYC